MKTKLQYITLTLALILLQVLIINNIEIAGILNPFIYIYPLLILPSKTNRIATLLIGFTTGLLIDAFCGTWGMHMASATLTAFILPYIFKLCASQEDIEKPTVSYHVMPSTFLKYTALIVFIHHLTLFTLEAFTFSHYWFTLTKATLSSLIAILLILIFEYIRTTNMKDRQRR